MTDHATAHPFEARCKLLILAGANELIRSFVGIAIELGRVPGELRLLPVLLGGWVECGFELGHGEGSLFSVMLRRLLLVDREDRNDCHSQNAYKGCVFNPHPSGDRTRWISQPPAVDTTNWVSWPILRRSPSSLGSEDAGPLSSRGRLCAIW